MFPVYSPLSLPLEAEPHEMTTTWERGRPARTGLAKLHLSPPLQSTGNGAVPGSLRKGCSRFVPHYQSPLEGESQKPSRQAKADAVLGESRPASAARPRRIASAPSRSTENSCAAQPAFRAAFRASGTGRYVHRIQSLAMTPHTPRIQGPKTIAPAANPFHLPFPRPLT